MSKYLEAARAMLSIPKEKDSWDIILEKDNDLFLWTDDDDCVERWNEIAGKSAGLDDVTYGEPEVANSDLPDISFRYRGKSIHVPLIGDRDDSLILIHTLNRLVMEDSEIRFCMDSWHSSDLAFLVLPPHEWASLESEFGRDKVAFRFLALPPVFDDFLKMGFSEKNHERYPVKEAEPSPTDLMQEAIKQKIHALVHNRLNTAQTHLFFSPTGQPLIVGVETERDSEREELISDGPFVIGLATLARSLCQKYAIPFQGIAIESAETINRDFEGIWFPRPSLLIHPDKVTTASTKARLLTFLQKHWLTVTFFAFTLSALIFRTKR